MSKFSKKITSLILCVLMVLSCLNVAVFTEIGTLVASAANVTIEAGDINGDGTVNNNDLTRLLKYLSGENVYVVEQLLDTNGDGAVNGKDLTRLMKYISGESVEIYPLGCIHSLTKNEKVDATCTKSGNIEYWQCNLCNRLFTDNGGTQETTLSKTVINAKGHSEEIIPAVAPSGSQYGYTEGVKCSVCQVVLVEPKPIDPLEKNEVYVEYDLSGNLASDAYLKNALAKKIADGEEIHPNDDVINTTNTAYSLRKIPTDTIPGYKFIGWYDGSGEDAKRVISIAKGQTGYLELFARWELNDYIITFSSEYITVSPIKNHNVNKATALPGADMMNLPGYRWLGWSDDNGNLYTSVYPAGKTGDIMLHANWQSYRKQAVPVEKLAEPKICIDEDAKTYMFTFRLGEIRNVPLYTICNFGKMIPGQPVVKEEVITTDTVTKEEAEGLAEIVAQATTKTTSWSLTNKWNKISSISESHCEEMGIDKEDIIYDFESDTSKLSLSDGYGQSESESVNYAVNAKIYGKVSTEKMFPVKVEAGLEIDEHSENTTVNDAYWNTSKGFENSFTSENSETTSEKLSQHIKDEYNLSTTIDVGTDQTVTEGCETSKSETYEYKSSVAYTQEEIKTTSYITEYTTDTEGWWRQVRVGTISVIGVVSYDIETSTYSAYTYGVLDGSSFQNYMDFSMESGEYDDHENGVIPFEVPISVNEYIADSLGYTSDLDVDKDTGMVTKYKGNSEHIHIPDYWTVNNGDGTYSAIKVTGIEKGAFANKTNIKSVRLSKYITEIPDNAFSGCTSLETIEYNEINSIGANAFANCISLKPFTVSTNIDSLGAGAFKNVPNVVVNAKNIAVLKAAVGSEIKNVEVYLKDLEDTLENTTLVITSATEKFAIYGKDKNKNTQAFNNVRIESAAAETIINGMKFVGNMSTPLELSSSKVTLAFVEVESSPGLAMILKADTTNLYLQDKINLKSNGNVTVLTKNITINEASGSNTTTTLSVFDGMLLYCGTFTDVDELFLGTKVNISKESYDQYFADSIPWVVESDVPAGATIIDTKWTYDKREHKTSNTPLPDDWTLYNTESTVGSWSSWSKTKPVAQDNREIQEKTVEDKTTKTTYWYKRYKYYNEEKNAYYYTYGEAAKGGEWQYKSSSTEFSKYKVYDGKYQGYVDSSGGLWFRADVNKSQGTKHTVFKVIETVVTGTHKEYRYQDTSYTYYYYKDTPLETYVDPTSQNDVYNIIKWVRYISQ